MKEAAATSVLSPRWENLWTFAVSSLTSLSFDARKTLTSSSLDPLKTFTDIRRNLNLLDGARSRYIRWVNRVLQLHQGQNLEEFRIRFHIPKLSSYSSDVNKWIDFALKNSVKRLELNLGDRLAMNPFAKNYTFPLGALQVSPIKSLTDIELKCIDVTGEVLEYILFNCTSLERLCLECSRCHVDLNVSGLPLKLKILEIVCCPSIKYINISAVNLQSFKCIGPEMSVSFENFPRLVEASFGAGFSKYVVHNFRQLSASLSRLKSLVMEIDFLDDIGLMHMPVLSHLKYLELIVDIPSDESLLYFAPFIRASPFLHRLVVKVDWDGNSMCDSMREPKDCPPHRCLKVVELLGYAGNPGDNEFAMYVMKSAVSLEKIVIDPCNPGTKQSIDEIEAARMCARWLKLRVGPGAGFKFELR
ncbi:hypothetical protein RJ639_034394 [Escallonia herrerae]|uniref:At1g61320/AtMIF1 LRR domain-containing protein n=1 Tax=Escallonia herrerae TaxID=1293975 RepID=A0AA89B830_9ASTE|nr:hypothetical protein RJ639_034394 [Escallonia herrerae]